MITLPPTEVMLDKPSILVNSLFEEMFNDPPTAVMPDSSSRLTKPSPKGMAGRGDAATG